MVHLFHAEIQRRILLIKARQHRNAVMFNPSIQGEPVSES